MAKTVLILIFCGFFGVLHAQYEVTGTITDEQGEPLIGVSVLEKNTNTGVISELDGSFRLRCSGPNATVVFSYVGYVTQEIPLNGQRTLTVKMATEFRVLEQVVVTGSRRQNRTQTETAVPVDVIQLKQVSQTTARFDLTSLLNSNAPSFNFNKQSGSDGADHIDLATLRGLGPDQTLVLLNGKRRHQTAFVAVFGARGRGNSGTDLSALPAAAIERVEILRDGASAQYGSDAIAGVINIVLKGNTGQVSADAGYSFYRDPTYNPAFRPELEQYTYEGKTDGAAFNASVNYGIGLGKNGGFLNATLMYSEIGKTYRQEMDGVLPTNIYRRAHGDASMQAKTAFFNLELPSASGKSTFYAFGGYNGKSSDAYAFTRNWSARPERFPTDASGNLIQVAGIMQTTSDGEIYFNPHIQTDITDVSIAAGVRGTTTGGWNWDLSNVLGKNTFHFYGDGTFNAGLGATQTSFDDGGFSFLQNTLNFNMSKEYADVLEGFNLAYGAELRAEAYDLFAGEVASYKNYNADKASGAQGFPGYQPGDEVNASRSTLGAYADVELDVSKEWMVAGAVRLENYSDFGFTSNFKLASRYKLADNFNLRGSVSTGFRAPSLQQINFSSTFTTVQASTIAEVKIAPNYSPITKAAGIPELNQEQSVNASLGFTLKPASGFTITMDAYQVKVKDRVVLSGQFSADDGSLNPALTGALQDLRVSLAQFFANAVNTTNRGIDLVLDYNKRFGSQSLRALVAANFQKMTIDQINVPDLLNDSPDHRSTFLSDREQKFILASAPPVKITSNLEYGIKSVSIGARLSYYGEVTLLGYGEDGLGINPMVPTDADETKYVEDKYVYGARLVPDLYLGVRLSEQATINLGVDNLTNSHPDLALAPGAAGWAFNNETGGPWDAVQMGGNGRRFFLRLGVNF